jgi:hypothetical protein
MNFNDLISSFLKKKTWKFPKSCRLSDFQTFYKFFGFQNHSKVIINHKTTLKPMKIDKNSVLACCGKMPVWQHKKCLVVQHNTQVHTQAKTTKIAQKYTKIHKFQGLFWTFHSLFWTFCGGNFLSVSETQC